MSGLERRSSVSWRPLEGWQVASKGLGPLPRRRGSGLAHGCGRGGRGALPLARAAAVSTGLGVRDARRAPLEKGNERRVAGGGDQTQTHLGWKGAEVARVRVRAKV